MARSRRRHPWGACTLVQVFKCRQTRSLISGALGFGQQGGQPLGSGSPSTQGEEEGGLVCASVRACSVCACGVRISLWQSSRFYIEGPNQNINERASMEELDRTLMGIAPNAHRTRLWSVLSESGKPPTNLAHECQDTVLNRILKHGQLELFSADEVCYSL